MDKFDELYTQKGEYHVQSYDSDPEFRKYIDSAIAFFNDKIGDSILVVGAGEGLETELLNNKNHIVDQIDISRVATEKFMARLKMKLFTGTAYYESFLDFKHEPYDWLLMLNTLHWIENETETVKKIKDLAKKGAYITVPDVPRSNFDLRGYTKGRLQELFPNGNIYLQDNVRWVVIWKNG